MQIWPIYSRKSILAIPVILPDTDRKCNSSLFFFSSTSSITEEKKSFYPSTKVNHSCPVLWFYSEIKILCSYLHKNSLCLTDRVRETDSGDLFSSFTSKECQDSNYGRVILCYVIMTKPGLAPKQVLHWVEGGTKWPPDDSFNLMLFHESNLLHLSLLPSLDIQIVQISSPWYNALLGSSQSQQLSRT